MTKLSATYRITMQVCKKLIVLSLYNTLATYCLTVQQNAEESWLNISKCVLTLAANLHCIL